LLADSYFPSELAEGSIIGNQENLTQGLRGSAVHAGMNTQRSEAP
jgi:hypothetical protein